MILLNPLKPGNSSSHHKRQEKERERERESEKKSQHKSIKPNNSQAVGLIVFQPQLRVIPYHRNHRAQLVGRLGD